MIALANIAFYKLVLLWVVGKLGAAHLNKYCYSDSDHDHDEHHPDSSFIMTTIRFSVVAKLIMFLSSFLLIRPSIAAHSEFRLVAFRVGLTSIEFQVYILIFSLEYVGQYCFGLLVFLLSRVVCEEIIEPGPHLAPTFMGFIPL